MRFISTTITALIIGILLQILTIYLYLSYGFSYTVVGIWLFSLLFVGFYFFRQPDEQHDVSRFTRRDWYTVLILAVVISVLYFSVGTEHPAQMVGDENSITIKTLTLSKPGIDLFKPTYYFNLPAPFFAISGYLASLFTYIDIFSIRLVSTFFGVLTCIISFFFFRRVFPDTFKATLATLLLATQHTLFALSHHAMLVNSAIFIYITSVFLLFTGLQRRSPFYSFLGGIVAGFGWYVYSPAKIIIFVWLTTLAILALLHRFKIYLSPLNLKLNLKRIIVPTIVGFLLSVCPFILGATILWVNDDNDGWWYQKSQFTLNFNAHTDTNYYPEYNGSVLRDIILPNTINALTVFNKPLKDEGWIYNLREKHGFVDSLTGIFLWIGVLATILLIRRERMETAAVLAHFLILLFVFMFLVNRAPNFTRMLIMLPFVIPLVVIGISRLSTWIISRFSFLSSRATVIDRGVLIVAVASVIWLNASIFAYYVSLEDKNQEPIAKTLRYIHHESKTKPERLYFFDKQKSVHYIDRWGPKDWQRVWINLSIRFNRPPESLTIEKYVDYEWEKDFHIFGEHREPVGNTVILLHNQIQQSSRYFYLVQDTQTTVRPESWHSNDWEIWLNLFTVFKQSFGAITPEQILSREYKTPATLFIPDSIWSTERDRIIEAGIGADARHLSSRKTMMVVLIEED